MRKAGRFAPSPTGPLHLGSLYTALASYLDARSLGYDWLVRIDDLDVPRTVQGAESSILRTLEKHGLHWDGCVRRQSTRLGAYHTALAELRDRNHVFYCTCSRRELRHWPIYPGTCRSRTHPINAAAVRVRADVAAPHFTDLIQGAGAAPSTTMIEDFIVKRRDGIIGYQLATAVDDGEAEVARVVRGRDLLDNTPRQLFLMALLGRSPPDYAHLPLLVSESGEKLSKQSGARSVDATAPQTNLQRCLKLLGFGHPPDADLPGLLRWAVENWSLAHLPTNDQIIKSE